ncbi:protein SON isoform 3-T3 [Leptodactylus fuscus]|uniref:protein SON isoform X3 n=1 Tax=Leptodactylus fuscus TaxID=238119 RepID=UPI003F4EFFE5
MKITGDKSDLSISQAGTGAAALQCEDPNKQLPITQLPGPLESMDSSHNGELTAPGTEDASEGSSAVTQNEGSNQTVTKSEEAESKPTEVAKSQNLVVEKESEPKDVKNTDLSSDDDVKRDSSKKKSKKHKKHKSKKKKKKKKKEKNGKRSRSASSGEDQENASSETKSAWKPVISSPREQDPLNTLSSQVEENLDAQPSAGAQDPIAYSVKEHLAGPQLDIDSGFFGPKCPNEMQFSVSSNNPTICEVEMQDTSKELTVDLQKNSENVKCTDQNNDKQPTNCETAKALQDEISLPQPGMVLSEGKNIDLGGSRLNVEENDILKQSDSTPSSSLQPQSKLSSTSLSKATAKSRSRSRSQAREIRSRSKSLTKVPKKQASAKSLTRQRSRSSSAVRRHRSRSSSVGQRRRSKSPGRRRRSQSSTPVRYSKSPIRSWWSKSIKNRQRSVSIERNRRSRTRSLAKRRRSRSRSSEKRYHSRTRSSAKRIRSRSRSANRRKSRSTSHKQKLRSRSASRRKSKSPVRTPSKSSSPSRKRKSKSASPVRRQKSKTASPVRRRRSRSRSAVQKRRSRSGAASRRRRSRSDSGSRRHKSRSVSVSKRRKSRSSSAFRRRRSRSVVASRRRRTRSPSASRRRRTRSPSVSRRRRTRSPSVSRRRKTRSPSVSRRRRTRSPSVSRRRRTRSPSLSRRRRTRSPSVSRRRRTRSPSVSRRRRTRSPSVSRRRRTRSPSVSRRRRTKSPSVSRRRRSRSPSASRRRRSRSVSVSRKRKSRSASVSRRRRSRSASVSRRRRSRSNSVSRRRRSRSTSFSRRRRSRSASRKRRSRSTSRRHRSKSDSVSRRRKSRTSSVTRRLNARSGSDTQRQKSLSYSATKRKSRSASLSRGEKSTNASKVQSREDRISDSSLERRSGSKGKNQESSSRSGSVVAKSKSVERDSALQSNSAEQRIPESMSLDEKTLSISASVEKHDDIKLPNVSSTSVADSKSGSSLSITSPPVTILIPTSDNTIEMEESLFVAADGNTLDCTSSTSVLDGHVKSASSKCPTEQIISSDIPSKMSSVPIDCTKQPTEVANAVDSSEVKKASDHKEQHTKVADLRIADESQQKDGTVHKPFGSSPDFDQLHGPLQPPNSATMKSTGHIQSELCDERSIAPLEDQEPPNSSRHNKSVEGKPEFGSDSVGKSLKAGEKSEDHMATPLNLKLSSADPSLNCVEMLEDSNPIKCLKNAEKVENWKESLHRSSALAHEGKLNVSPVTFNKELDLLSNKQENVVINNLISNENQNFPGLSNSSSIFPGSLKRTEEDVSQQRDIPNFKSLTSGEDNMRISNEIENGSASGCGVQSSLLGVSSFKDHVPNECNFKEAGELEILHPRENKMIEVKSVNEEKPLSSFHVSEDHSSQVEEQNNLPKPSLYEMTFNTSHSIEGDNNESTSMELESDSDSSLPGSPIPPSIDYHDTLRPHEPLSNATNLTAETSTKISEPYSEENLSIRTANNEASFVTGLTESKVENQRGYEVFTNTNTAESNAHCKIVGEPSPYTMNEGYPKQEAGKLCGSAAPLESIQNNEGKVISQEKTRHSEQNSLTVLHGEKQCPSTFSHPFNADKENKLSRNIVEHTASVSKDSEIECLTSRTVNVDYNSQEESSKSSTLGSRASLETHKNEERLNLEQRSSIQSFKEVKQPALETQEQSAKGLTFSKSESASSGLREIKSSEDPKSSPKPFLQESGRLSATSVPVQFKFSKTFKTLGVSQLCSASEDSSDVEISKVNTSSSGVMHNNIASTESTRSSSKTSSHSATARQSASVSVEPSKSSQDASAEHSNTDHQSGQLTEKESLQPDNLQAADDSQTGSNSKHTFPHISNTVSKLGVKQRQYRSRSVAQDSRTPSVDRGRGSRSRSKSRRRRSHSKSSSRKKRSQSTARKKSSHSKSDRRKRSRSRSRGRKRRSQSKSKGKKKRSTSKLSGKRKRSKSKSLERTTGSKTSGKQRSSRSTSKTRKKSKSPEKKARSRSKSEGRKNLHSKTASTRKTSRSKSPNRRRKSRSKSLSSRSRSRSMSASWKTTSHSKSSLHRKRSRSSSRSVSPRRLSRSRNKRSFSRSPATRSHSRSRSRWHRSRSRGRWHRSRSLSASRRRSRSTSRLSSSKKRKSVSPVCRRRSRSQNKQKDKSPVSKRKSTSPPPPQKKSAQSKPAGFKHSIGLKSLIQKQLSQAKSQGSTGKLSKEQIPLPNVTGRTQSFFSTRAQSSMSNLSNIGQIPVPNLSEVPLPSVSAGNQVPMPMAPPAEPHSVSSLAAETQLSVPDLTTANQWHVPDMSSGAAWSVPDIAAGTQWSMADLGAGAQWPMSDLTAGSHWPMHDLTVGAQWSMPDLAAGTQWAVPDVATGAQWAVPDLAAGTQWTVPDLTAGSQWAMTNLTAGAQWAVPDLAATAQWTVPDLTAGAQIQRADLAPEAQVPGSDLTLEAQVPGSDLAAEAQVPGSDLAAEAQVPGSDMVAEAQVPPEHDLPSEHNVMPDVAAEALVPVASSTVVPDVAAGIPLPDVTAAAQMPVPDVAATLHMPDVATEAQKQMSDYTTQAYMSLSPEESVEDSCYEGPIVPSEHHAEADSCPAFVQPSPCEPDLNTSKTLKMEEPFSSVQQLPLDFENSQSTESNDKIASLDKEDLQLNQDPVTGVPINPPQVEPAMDSECPLNSETYMSTDVPIASRESSDLSIHSISGESNTTHDRGLFESDNSLHRGPHVISSNVLVDSQSSSIQTGCVEPRDECDQPLHVTNSATDSNLQTEPCNKSDTLIEEPYSESASTDLAAPCVSPKNILKNEPSVNCNTTLEVNSCSVSDINVSEDPNNSQEVELNPSLGRLHPTEHPQLVEPYTSPDHTHLVEPYTSPVHPQLVEPYTSPQQPPLVELYPSPEHPQLVEPYASPDFPQLVEPYASPERQELVEPCTDTERTQISESSMSLLSTENNCSSSEKPEEHSVSEHNVTCPTVAYTKINTDSSDDNSGVKNDLPQLQEYPITSDVPENQIEIVDSDYCQSSKLNNESSSVQEVPCHSPLKVDSSESNFSSKEVAVEDCLSPKEQSIEPSTGSYLEHLTSPAQPLTKDLCSPHTAHKVETIPATDHELLYSANSNEPQLDSSCVVTSQSKEQSSVKEVFHSHTDFIASEQVPEKLYNIPVQPQENLQSPSIMLTNEQCISVAHVPVPEYEPPSAEDTMSHPDKNSNIPVLSNTIISLHGVDPSCTTIPLKDKPEQETIAQHSYPEESKATSGCYIPDKLPVTQVDTVLEKTSLTSDPVVIDDSQGIPHTSPSKQSSDYPNSFFPEESSDADHSTPLAYSTKINQVDQTEDSPHTSVLQSQEVHFERDDENPLASENGSFPAGFPCLSQDRLQCETPNQASDFSVECIKHTTEDSVECTKIDTHFTTTPPDLLPYDSDQPTGMCSEPLAEPVSFNSQPPPELLPYDSEQPANSFHGTSEYSTEQGSSDFHAPPELLPYDSDQPTILHNQETEPTGEELTIYDSATTNLETCEALRPPSAENGENSASLGIHEIPEKSEPPIETFNPPLDFVKEVSSECPSTEQAFAPETLQENSVPSAVVDCTQKYPSSSLSLTDEHHFDQQSAENEQPVVQTVLGSQIPERPISRSENQTEQPSLKNISDTSEAQCTSSDELNASESETSRLLPLMQEVVFPEASNKTSPLKSLTNTESSQPQPVSKTADPISELKSRREHSRSRSIERKKSRSKSVSKTKRSRSKSVTRTKKSHSKSLVRSRKSKSRSASAESNKRSPSVAKRKESTYLMHKRSSRSASVGRRRRSRSSVSPRKRSHSSSVGRKSHRRRSHSQSRQRHSRSPSESRKRSRSPSVTNRRRSHSLSRRRRSSSVTYRRRSRSTSATRKKSSSSPTTRRRRSPSATRRRRSPSPVATRRRRSPSATRRRRSRTSSATRRRRSRSLSATRRRRSPSPSASRRRRSPSPSATRRRRSPSPAATRRRRSPSPSVTRRRRSPSPSATRRRRSPSPSASRRRRSPSSSEFRRKRSPSLSVSHKRHSHSPSVPRKRRSRSTSASRRRQSRSSSQRRHSSSPSAPKKRRSKSKSPSSKSPTGKQSKSERSRSLSQTEVSRKRKTRSRSSSRDKKTIEKRRRRSSSKDSSKDYYSIKQRRKSRTPPRRKKSRSPSRRASVCKSPVRRRRSRSPIRRKSFSRSPIRRKRSRSRDKSMDSARSPKRLTDLDKAQLLEIAKANAAAMCAKSGVPLPPSLKPVITPAAPVEEKITHRTYGVTIQELTEKCKQIAQSKEDDVIVNKPHDSDDEEEDRPFYNHPFKVSEHKPISFSLLNPSLKPAPKNQVTLTKEFPVSSGSQHRKKESDKVYGEWVPVDKNTEESKDDVFTNTGPAQPVDITSAMNERAVAQTRLTGNPYDIEALFMLNRAQEQIDAWAQSTSIPGQFTGSTGAQVLSAEEISNSGPQAWLKKDQFLKAAPVTGGRGALLMRKMGWKEGEGLGRNNEGNVDPILLDFKTDRKGLVADGEKASNKLALPAMKDLSGKHPISALMELCNKKKWSPPEFELVDDTGPEHRKRFLFRVTVNGVLCQPSQPSLTKKLAKATAAAAALQALGALPKESMTSTSNFCSASSSTL